MSIAYGHGWSKRAAAFGIPPPELQHTIKERIDEDRAPGRWLLTGSQSFSLMRGVSQSLAGWKGPRFNPEVDRQLRSRPAGRPFDKKAF